MEPVTAGTGFLAVMSGLSPIVVAFAVAAVLVAIARYFWKAPENEKESNRLFNLGRTGTTKSTEPAKA